MLSQPDSHRLPLSTSSWSDETLEKEYRRLLRAVRMARGRFALYPIESNLPAARREALLDRFGKDLEAQGQGLRHVALSREGWQLLSLPEMKSPVLPDEVMLVTGLENTPEMATAYGSGSHRPPFLALLNHLRETLRQCVPAPFLLWCPSAVYNTLIAHAPDFFDHAVGLFRFVDDIVGSAPFIPSNPTPLQTDTTPASPTLVAFYREQLSELSVPTLEHAVALLDLGEALYSLHFTDPNSHLREARACAVNALRILAPRRSRKARYQWARGNALLAETYLYSLPEDRGDNFLKSIRYFEQAQVVFERLGDVRERAVTMGKVADILQLRGELDEALRIRREEELPIYERLGDVRSRAVTIGKIADILYQRGEIDEALRVLREEELPVYERLGDMRSLLVGRANLAMLLIQRQRTEDAEEIGLLLTQAHQDAVRLRLPEAYQLEQIVQQLFRTGE